MEHEPILQVRNLTTRFYTEEGTVHAVNGISYDLNRGEVLGIVGESGSGKSAHALSIMRLLPSPSGKIVNGSILFDGRDLTSLSEKQMRHIRGREIAMVFQDPIASLNPVLTIGEQVEETLLLHSDIGKQRARQRAIELLDLVGIPDPSIRANSYPHQLSGGMRQRAMIAMGLSCNPRVLIADEPTTALDVTIQAQIMELVNDLRKQFNMSIIWITHDLGVVAGIADRVLVMYAGNIVEEAEVDDLFADPCHPYTLGLLHSRPRVDKRRAKEKLLPISGSPPNMLSKPKGCPFIPRCSLAIERCHEQPPLVQVGPNHRAACWVNVREAETHEKVL